MLIRHTICFINILKIHWKKKYKYLNYEFFIEQNSPFKKNIHPRNFKNLLYFYTFIIQFKELEFKKGKNKFLNVGKCKIITSTRFEAGNRRYFVEKEQATLHDLFETKVSRRAGDRSVNDRRRLKLLEQIQTATDGPKELRILLDDRSNQGSTGALSIRIILDVSIPSRIKFFHWIYPFSYPFL